MPPRLAGAALAVALGVSASASAALPPEWVGRTVIEVRFLGEDGAPIEVGGAAQQVRTIPGRTLEASDVADALRGLASDGAWDEIAAEGEASEDGVRLVYRLVPRPRMAALTFAGPRAEEAAAERPRLDLADGEVFDSRLLDAGTEAIRRALVAGGWDGPEVTWTAAPATPGGRDVAVVVTATSGPARRLRTLRLDGAEEPMRTRLAAKSPLDPGDRLRPADIEAEVARVRTALRSEGHWSAQVEARPGPADADGFLDLVLQVSAGPAWTVQRSGHAPKLFPPEAILENLEEFTGEVPDERFAAGIAGEIRHRLQDEGFPDPVVRVTIDPSVPSLSIAVEEGLPARIREIVFPGADSIPASELRAAMELTPKGLLGGGYLTDRSATRDTEALTGLFRSRGFLDAVVGPMTHERLPDGGLRLVVPVVEGIRCRVESMVIEGIPVAEAEEVAKGLALLPGRDYDAARVADDLFRLKSVWADRGHLEIRVEELPPVFSADRSTVRLAWRVTPGPVTHVDRILIRGNDETRDEIILRAVGFQSGDALSLRKLLDARLALVRTGLFTRVDLEPVGPEGRPRRDVLVTIVEGNPLSLTLGAGIEYDTNREQRWNPRGSIALYHNNLFGTARLAGFEARISGTNERFVLAYREPDVFGTGLPLTVSVFRAKEERESISTTLHRRGTFVDTVKALDPVRRLQLRYEYQIVTPTCDETQVDCSQVLGDLEKQDQANATNAISPAFIYDRRNDPFDPTSGVLGGIEAKWAFPLFDADSEFWKVWANGAVYHKIGPVKLAATLRAGMTEPLKPVTNEEGLPNLEIPIPERFYAGGPASHRAFPIDELGIPGQTVTVEEDGDVVPSGGNAMVLGGLEARVPIWGKLEGAIFWDTGNVWAEASRVNLSEIRHGIGIGARFQTPVGPIRVDYAWKLDREAWESAGEFYLSIGYPF